MSLYNALFGENSNSDLLLFTLGLSREDCGRYRDCYLAGDMIVIYTRNGGGNRDEYEYIFEELSEHPNYISDEDDDFDCTYARIYFSFPERFKAELTELAAKEPTQDPKLMWDSLLEALKNNK